MTHPKAKAHTHTISLHIFRKSQVQELTKKGGKCVSVTPGFAYVYLNTIIADKTQTININGDTISQFIAITEAVTIHGLLEWYR